jgi:zinc and cadmium transporter
MQEVWIYSLFSVTLVSLASFVGVITLSIGGKRLNSVVFVLVALAVGALFGDVFIHILPELFYETGGDSKSLSLYILLGIIIFFVLEKILRWHHFHDIEDGGHSIRHIGHMNLISDGVHNFIDGIFIAISYVVSIPVGIATTIAVVLHELPQEIGDFGVLIHSGFTKRQAIFYNFISSVSSVLGALIILLFGEYISSFSSVFLAITAGTFIYIAGSDLVPELHKLEDIKRSSFQLIAIIVGMSLMFLVP